MLKKRGIAFTLLFFMLFIFFQVSGFLQAEELIIAFSYDIPPFVTNNGLSGIEIDIVTEALQYKGYIFTTIQCSYKELEVAIIEKGIDAAAGVREIEDSTYYSDYFIFFKNFAISKRRSGIVLDSIPDLKDRSIITWQNAYRDLGLEFAALFSPSVKENYVNKYIEYPDQEKQVEMFWLDQVEVIIIDEYIFRWFTRNLAGKIDTSEEVVYHDLFPDRTEFQLNFKDKQIRDDFNAGLKHILENGQYQEIINKYIN
ncbi:MAG: transporter substrate-binding domain-containing protein [Candidatus Cloacimonetes bacterium]|nr:transporter substrate-binding domain-containing protein [Candidatus Cloacimonadota bacterium]